MSRSKRNDTVARPETRPDCLASRTEPRNCEPAGTTVVPSMRIGCDSFARTGSSARLLSDATAVSSVRLSGVPAGTFTFRNCGLVDAELPPEARAAAPELADVFSDPFCDASALDLAGDVALSPAGGTCCAQPIETATLIVKAVTSPSSRIVIVFLMKGVCSRAASADLLVAGGPQTRPRFAHPHVFATDSSGPANPCTSKSILTGDALNGVKVKRIR